MARRKGSEGPDGLLLVDKPSGLTSFDVVARLRRLYQTRRIGHTGTLDPMATGLMVVLIGRATRLAPFITDTDKQYEATVCLGRTTNTYDAEGETVATVDDLSGVARTHIESALSDFRGQIQQVPPIFSAIKIDGDRAYARARRGEDIVMKARTVTIHTLKCVGFDRPDARFIIRCSKGTYIRSLAHDIGMTLGIGAHLSALRRTAVGRFQVSDALTLAAISDMTVDERQQQLRTLADAVAHLPAVRLDDDTVIVVRHGKRIELTRCDPGLYRALDGVDELVAILEVEDQGRARVRRGFPPPAT